MESHEFDKSLSNHVVTLGIKETETFELLFISGCIGYEEEDKVDEDNVVKTESGVQTEIKRQRHIATVCSTSFADFSSQVSETILFDEFNCADDDGLGFQNNAMIMSRVLASNVHKPFGDVLGRSRNDPLDLDVQFRYMVIPLPELRDPKLKSAHVTAISRNSDLDYLYAAGFAVGHTGGIALFSLKNALRTEKIHRLKDAVVCLNFSDASPNLLAVGTLRGTLIVFDVSGNNFKTMHMVHGLTNNILFVVVWWDEFIIWNNGEKILCLDRPFITSKTKTIMKIPYLSSKKSLSLTLGPKVTGLLRHPTKIEEYVVSGTDGVLRYCSSNNQLEVLELITDAHVETISGIRTVPHSAEMFLTFGCDGTVKLWAWAVKKPLIVFKTDEKFIELCDACWSPLHATIVVSCSRKKIFMWDVRRRTHVPVAVTDTQNTCLNIQFSANGEFLIVGTADGSIMFLGLAEMPFPEKLKKIAFRNAILHEIEASGQHEYYKICKYFPE